MGTKVSERWQLWMRGKQGYVSPSLCTWPATVKQAEALEGALRLASGLIYGSDGDLRLEGQIVIGQETDANAKT